MFPKQSLVVLLILLSGVLVRADGPDVPSSGPVVLAQRQVSRYLSKLADLHCTETVTQQKLNAKGHADSTERSQFDYLIMMSGSNESFQLNESRIETPDAKHKQVSMPMLTTNGMTTLLLVFHPYYSDAFSFEEGPEQVVQNKATIPIHFAHISGRRTPAALALRGREFPLELKGTAWLDKASGEVIQADASLEHDMSDVGLRSLEIHVEYKAENVGSETWTLPSKAVVDVTTPKQHWRNTHVFEGYKSFSTDAQQDPNYKVRPDAPAQSTDQPQPKEQQ
ncbi:hypothetical protein [Occallatibacter savannae]|uniref:hypothetical protein n=1 Tax=Occallatibacter savannae TaxID=1002691 RepID=UPI000D69E317|nr:hypothetical protein [Occallatibacter savannae]